MLQRVFCFVVVCFLLNSSKIFAQQKQDSTVHISIVANPLLKDSVGYNKQVLPAGFYFNSLGFFCKKEIQFEKATSVPLRIRLGSLDYTNYLEQKPNALKPIHQ
ncbi:MAG: hypothetical protein JSU05_04610 [Bacteroidetes bacterium]|nr:hypothetical protein [Bacteroidota bacterium]